MTFFSPIERAKLFQFEKALPSEQKMLAKLSRPPEAVDLAFEYVAQLNNPTRQQRLIYELLSMSGFAYELIRWKDWLCALFWFYKKNWNNRFNFNQNKLLDFPYQERKSLSLFGDVLWSFYVLTERCYLNSQKQEAKQGFYSEIKSKNPNHLDLFEKVATELRSLCQDCPDEKEALVLKLRVMSNRKFSANKVTNRKSSANKVTNRKSSANKVVTNGKEGLVLKLREVAKDILDASSENIVDRFNAPTLSLIFKAVEYEGSENGVDRDFRVKFLTKKKAKGEPGGIVTSIRAWTNELHTSTLLAETGATSNEIYIRGGIGKGVYKLPKDELKSIAKNVSSEAFM